MSHPAVQRLFVVYNAFGSLLLLCGILVSIALRGRFAAARTKIYLIKDSEDEYYQGICNEERRAT